MSAIQTHLIGQRDGQYTCVGRLRENLVFPTHRRSASCPRIPPMIANGGGFSTAC